METMKAMMVAALAAIAFGAVPVMADAGAGQSIGTPAPQQECAAVKGADLAGSEAADAQGAGDAAADETVSPDGDSGKRKPRARRKGERKDAVKEYNAGNGPMRDRVAAPVNDDWPETGFWLSTLSGARHNSSCENYRKTRGYPCGSTDGRPCGKCGG